MNGRMSILLVLVSVELKLSRDHLVLAFRLPTRSGWILRNRQ